MKSIRYSCGCSFKMNDTKIIFDADISTINLECSKTWDLIGSGNTKGCFQLESRLGRSMAKKLKPENIEQLSALISIMRPGCLEAYREGKSVSSHYIDRKNGIESIDYFHPSLRKILESSYGEMIYQEQAMEIAKEIAGFNLQEADMLRKAIGKKKAEEMAKVKTQFIKGCNSANIVTEDQAEQIFSWIEKSQRYLFNKSHSISYAMNAYLSAYAKAHFPKIFFAAYLRFAKDKIDPQTEIKELIQNASEMNIDVHIPDIRLLNQFFALHNDTIYFGLTDIKGVGVSVYEKILKIVNSFSLDVYSLSWIDWCLFVLLNINSTASKALICSGALDFLTKSRNSMLFEYGLLSQLTKKELEHIHNLKGDLLSKLKFLSEYSKVNKNRKNIILNLIMLLKNPPHSLVDGIQFLSDQESGLLGYCITSSKIEMYDTSIANTLCKEFKGGKKEKNMIIAAEIDNINVVKTKKGKFAGSEMAFVSIADHSGVLDDVILFPEQYTKYKNVLFEENVLLFQGNRSASNDAFIIEKCYIAKT